MNDLETMRAMLARAGIEFEEAKTEPVIAKRPADDKPSTIQLRIERGYPTFYTMMTFDLDGKLLDVEAYE